MFRELAISHRGCVYRGNPKKWEQYLVAPFGATVAGVGIIVLIGWSRHSTALIQLLPNGAPMQRNTALGLACCGASLMFFIGGKAGYGRTCGVLGGTLGLLTLIEYATRTYLGIDQMLGVGFVLVKTSHPGRMSPLTAFCLTITGTALSLVWSGMAMRRRALVGAIAGGMVTAVALASILSYFLGASPLLNWTYVTFMAIHTASGFLLLGSSLLIHARADDLRFREHSANLDKVRRPYWVPIIAGALAGAGLLALWQGAIAGGGSSRLLVVYSGFVMCVLFAFLFALSVHLMQTARQGEAQQEQSNQLLVDEIEERKRIGAHLEESETRLKTILETATEAIVGGDSQGGIVAFNRTAEQIFGWTAIEIIGKPLTVLMPERFRDAHRKGMQRYLTTGEAHVMGKPVELVGMRRDGGEFPVELSLASWKAQGNIFFTGILRDITEHKRAEEALRDSEEQIRLLLDSTAEAIYAIDLKGNCTLYNPACLRILGYDAPSDLMGKHMHSLVHHTRADGTAYPVQECLIYKAFRAGEGCHVDHEVIWRKDGTSFPAEYWSYPMRRNGQTIGAVVTFIDITIRKRAEKDRSTLIAVLENSPDLIGIGTLDAKPFFVNVAGRKMIGLPPDLDVSTTSIPKYFDDETAAMFMNTAIPAIFSVGHWQGEGNLRHFGTRALIPVHIVSFIVNDPETHQPMCFAAILRNISEIKEGERKLLEAHGKLLEVSRLSGMAEVATSVLHNVGNVLNSVNVSTDRITEKLGRLKPASLDRVAGLLREHAHDLPHYLSRDPQGSQLPGYLLALVEQMEDPQKDILPEVVSLRKNIEHIRAIVRLQQDYGKVSGVLETIPLADVVEDAIRIAAASLTRHEVELVREYSPVPPFPLDKHRVLQILVNLLSNAKHALDAGAVQEKKITLRIEKSDRGMARVSVIDNGAGIAPEHLARIFQHGFTTKSGGHGFGLHSGVLAAKELGGSLTVHSDGILKGATFTLELPSSPAAAGSNQPQIEAKANYAKP